MIMVNFFTILCGEIEFYIFVHCLFDSWKQKEKTFLFVN